MERKMAAFFGQSCVGCDGVLDPMLQLRDLLIQQLFEVVVHVREHVRGSKLSMCFDLSQKPLPCFDQLATL
ncbi:hypothetical protein ACFOHS_10985 [Jhaorihella thermophila]